MGGLWLINDYFVFLIGLDFNIGYSIYIYIWYVLKFIMGVRFDGGKNLLYICIIILVWIVYNLKYMYYFGFFFILIGIDWMFELLFFVFIILYLGFI